MIDIILQTLKYICLRLFSLQFLCLCIAMYNHPHVVTVYSHWGILVVLLLCCSPDHQLYHEPTQNISTIVLCTHLSLGHHTLSPLIGVHAQNHECCGTRVCGNFWQVQAVMYNYQ